MTWVRLDDAMPLHSKVLPLSDGAFRAHVEAICHCARSLTDGHVASKVARAHHWTKRAPELVEAGLWEPIDDGWLVHDYLDFNPSREQIEAERQRKSAAGRLGGKRSAAARAQPSAEAPASTVLEEVPNPVPSRPVRELPSEVPTSLFPEASLTTEQRELSAYLLVEVHRLVYGGSSAPAFGFCEDLIRAGATRSDVDAAVQASLGKGEGYVRRVLQRRVQDRQAGRDPDAERSSAVVAGGRDTARNGPRAMAPPGGRARPPAFAGDGARGGFSTELEPA